MSTHTMPHHTHLLLGTDLFLPPDAEWATAPLLDPANVGRYVICSDMGNMPSVRPVQSVGRTNVHVGRHRPASC